MNKSTGAKRQTRTILAAAVLIAAMAAVIIFLGVQQSRRTKETPPPDISETVKAPETSRREEHVDSAKEYGKETEKTQETNNAESVAETDAAAPTSVPDPLPSFIAPVSGMVSKAHSVDVPVYSLTMEDYRTHCGVDIAASAGTAVRAAADGTVGEIWEEPMMGVCLSVVHSGGAKSVYKNLAPEIAEGIESGAAVKAGTILGAVGESALAEIAESSHLHYELEIDGVSVDPAEFMLLGSTDTAYEG